MMRNIFAVLGALALFTAAALLGAAPLLAAYALDRHQPRTLRRLYDRRDEMLALLRRDYDAK